MWCVACVGIIGEFVYETGMAKAMFPDGMRTTSKLLQKCPKKGAGSPAQARRFLAINLHSGGDYWATGQKFKFAPGLLKTRGGDYLAPGRKLKFAPGC